MTTIGYATLAIIPSLKGISAAIDKQLAAETNMGKTAGQKLGSNIVAGVGASQVGGKIGRDLETEVGKSGRRAGLTFSQEFRTPAEKAGAAAGLVIGKTLGAGIKLGIAGAATAAAAGIAGIGYTLTKGFERLQSIDTATFKLKALGHSGDETKQIMDNALASVKGTAFGLADAATAAASAVAAGIKPGQDLTKYLSEVGDAAAVAGTNFNDMGAIFNKIQTSNKAFTDDLNQLSDKGLPIFKWLQDEYGVTADKLSDMVQKGEVDSAHFQAAIDKNIGGAAQKMGQSFDGAVQNLEASVARLGANFITAILGGDQGGDALAGPTQAIGNLTAKFDDIGKWVQAHAGEIRAFFVDVKNYAVEAAGAVKKIGEFLLEHKGIIEASAGVWLGWKAISVVAGVATSVKAISAGLSGLGAAAEVGGAGAVSGLTPLVSFLASNPILAALLTAGAFGAGIGPLLNAGADDRRQKLTDAWNKNAAGDAGVPAVIGPVQGPGVGPVGPSSGPQLPVSPPVGPSPGSGTRPGGTVIQVTPKSPLEIIAGRATGGSIRGPGSGTSDSIPAWLSNGEHVLTAKDVQALGGQAGVYALRNSLHRAGGGEIWKTAVPWGVDPHGSKDSGPSAGPFRPWWDMDWMPPEHPERIGPGKGWWWYHGPTKEKGITGGPLGPPIGKLRPPRPGDFYPGMIPDPEIKTWGFKVGGAVNTANTGGSLTPNATQLKQLIMQAFPQITNIGGWRPPDGYNEHSSGQALDVMIPNPSSPAGKALGDQINQWLLTNADSLGIQYDLWQQTQWNPNGTTSAMSDRGSPTQNHRDHVHVRVKPGPATGASLGAPSNTAAPVAQDTSSSDQTAAPDSSSGGGASLPSSISGLASFGLASLGSGVGTTGSGSDLSKFGSAASAAVSGQVSSALGVFGGGDNPPFLQAASQLLSGIKIGGHAGPGKSDGSMFDGSNIFRQGRAGSSAVPISASPVATSTPLPDGVHNGTGQAPGPPQVVYNIRTATVEDAFLAAQRKQNERNAAKLSRF